MTRTLHRALQVLAGATLIVLFTSAFVFAQGYYNNSYNGAYNNSQYNNSYDYNYNASLNNSYNNYNSYNNSSGYPYYNYSDNSYRYNGYNYNYNYRPNCSITVTNSSGSYGYDRYVTLAWSSSYATSGYISGVGSVGVNGAQAVYYPYNNTYTLTVYGPGGTATCSTNNPYYATQLYNNYNSYNNGYNGYAYNSYAQPLSNYTYATPVVTYATPTYQYVKLAQTPYTGFDYGPVGNMLYWLGMIVVAFAGAYLIVYSRGWHFGGLAREVAEAARNQIRIVRTIVR